MGPEVAANGADCFRQQTLENTREKDETMVRPDDEEIAADEATDEFSGAPRPNRRVSAGRLLVSQGCEPPVSLTPAPKHAGKCSAFQL